MTELGDPATRSSRGPKPRIFEGRSEHIGEFKRRLKAYAQYPVWQIFGVAGIGKTALLGKFAQLASGKSLPVALLNTGRETKTETDALQQIASQLGEPEFPTLRREIELQKELEVGGQSRRRLASRYASPLTRKIPGLDVALQRRAETWERQVLLEAHERLFDAFTADLDSYLRTPGRRAPAVFLIDTYEDIKGTPLDSLFRRMASSLRKCVFVFAGREPLEWEKLPHPEGRKWSRRPGFKPLELDRFTPDEAENYLRRRKIPAAVCQRIIEYTNCFPLFLEMAADLARDDAKAGRTITPDDFPSARFDENLVADFLFKRILERITGDPTERDFICAMGLCRWYDMRLAASLAPGGPGTVHNLLSRLNSYHFVRPLLHDRFAFHDSVRLAAARSFDHFSCPEKRTEAHQKAIAIHQKRAEAGDDDSLLELCYHRFHLNPKDGTEFWMENLDRLRRTADMQRHDRLVMDFIAYGPPAVGGYTRGHVLVRAAIGLLAASTGKRSDNVLLAIAYLEESLSFFPRDQHPTQWAVAQNNLGTAFYHLPTGSRSQNLIKAIRCFNQALTELTPQGQPKDWAMTQNNLGIAYAAMPGRGRAQNLARAITHYTRALQVYTRSDFPEDWATMQGNLGNAYLELPTGDRDKNLITAISHFTHALDIFTSQGSPLEWANTQISIGAGYYSRQRGDRAENLARAIASFNAALTVYTRDAFPERWAGTHNNLGTAHLDLPGPARVQNLKTAIACFKKALKVYRPLEFPADWAMTLNNLATAYADPFMPDPAKNLRKAIACFKAALRVYMRDQHPTDWAMTQVNLAEAYRRLPTADRASRLMIAIACLQSALKVYTPTHFPDNWAKAQNNLGACYAELPTGDRAQNLLKAISCYHEALKVHTRSDYPLEWAKLRYNIGVDYMDLSTGDRAENLKTAIACFGEALTVYTEDAFPHEHGIASRNLALASAELDSL